jgi:hypothetical protein
LAGIADWSNQYPFIDFFKSARPWITSTPTIWNTNEFDKLELDRHGWVVALPGDDSGANVSSQFTQVTTLVPNAGVFDRYLVVYDGQGIITYGRATKDVAVSTPGRDVIEAPGDRSIILTIVETDPDQTGNYLRNIQVIPEPFADIYRAQIFNPDFIEHLRGFKVLRFMDWMQTNHSSQSEWGDMADMRASQRPHPDDATYSTRGVPLEVMVELSNQTGIAPWFNMPHLATDNYMKNFAEYVHAHLDPTLPVYIEFSNEVWNGQFTQARYARQQGDGDFGAGLQWFGHRTADMTLLWEQVFQAEADRVIGVLGAQAANRWTAQQALHPIQDAGLEYNEIGIDAIAIAPYFGGNLGRPDHEEEVERWTHDPDGGLSLLFQELTVGGVLSDDSVENGMQQSYAMMKDYAEFAQQEGLMLLAYEGGQHLVGRRGVVNNDAITALFIAANRDPRMGELYRDYFLSWHQAGGGVFAHFTDIGSATKWGSWGSRESLYQESSPKYDAIEAILND